MSCAVPGRRVPSAHEALSIGEFFFFRFIKAAVFFGLQIQSMDDQLLDTRPKIYMYLFLYIWIYMYYGGMDYISAGRGGRKQRLIVASRAGSMGGRRR